ncbi:prolyl oligopeptidase family serine peptidase, partial [Caballeronia grimmiae]|uniref:prolyl oligopeptidase family serine peptidase n=1 Tax=Caballeronia grimmiae TaxID=1071679 RepID=UPI0038B868D1
RLPPAVVLAIALAGCGGADSTSTDAGATSAKALAVAANATSNRGSTSPGIVKLQRYQIDPQKVFVAGISSGGFAAVQMHVAHSSTFKGAAVYAGGVYWCAGAGGAVTALANCGGLTLPSNQAAYNSMLTMSEAYLDA